jgi:hypothetical protein
MSEFSYEIDESTHLTLVLKKLFLRGEFFSIRILILLSLLSGLVTLLYRSYTFSCQLSIVQNILLPFVETKVVLRALRFPEDKRLSILGIKLGIFIGGVSAFVTLLVSNLQYYFGGDREAAFLLRQQPVPPLSFGILWAGLSSQVFLWLFLITLSAIAGLMATIRLRKNK